MKVTTLIAGALTIALITQNPAVIAANDPGKTATVKATALTVDPAKSTMTWQAKKVGGEHSGNVKIAKGVINIESNKLLGGNFVMDMTSITDTDITNETFNKKLTDHLKSEDFFSVEKNPTSTFKITKAAPISGAKTGEANYTITGDLTIKGITHPVTFPATVKISGNSAEATAKFDVDRTKWDIKYRAAIIGTAADKIIDDNFTIDLKIVAGKSSNNI
jgi:polyisoprenoid-binding protein YceI